MSTEDYLIALMQRGFDYYGRRRLWIGPNNIQISGQWNWDKRPDAGVARAKILADIDKMLKKIQDVKEAG